MGQEINRWRQSGEISLSKRDLLLKGEMSMLINGSHRASEKERLKMKKLTKMEQAFKRSLD